jgi:predicted dehydrogenase
MPDPSKRRLRAGIVGGGRGAFIGSVHRLAAELDGQALVVAGAMSSDPTIARESAAAWLLERSYDSYEEMARSESADANGIDFVIVATPNHLHFPVARAFLTEDIHVVCDKPLAASLADGEELGRLVAGGTALFALTHNYTGYPMVREARGPSAQRPPTAWPKARVPSADAIWRRFCSTSKSSTKRLKAPGPLPLIQSTP